MKRFGFSLCCVFAFLGILICGVKEAKAVLVMIYWGEMDVCGLDDPQMMNQNVFSYKQVGGLNPPARGGVTAIVDIADRTYSQMRLLESAVGGPGNGRFVLKFGPETQWIYNQLYYKGFVTLRWAQARAVFWDKLNNRFPTGPWRWTSDNGQLWDDCSLNCDVQACIAFGYDFWDLRHCECEEWQGRWFCHKKNFFTYSDAPDQR